jgi:hypothetical protein
MFGFKVICWALLFIFKQLMDEVFVISEVNVFYQSTPRVLYIAGRETVRYVGINSGHIKKRNSRTVLLFAFYFLFLLFINLLRQTMICFTKRYITSQCTSLVKRLKYTTFF